MKGEKKPLAPTKRWKRGQSCVSNPEYRKFRDAAKKTQSSGFQFSSKSESLGILQTVLICIFIDT